MLKLKTILKTIFRRWYILHEDLQTPENGTAIFGPFWGWEISKRLNDAYADGLASSGWVEALALSRRFSKTVHINSRKYWMKQLKEIQG